MTPPAHLDFKPLTIDDIKWVRPFLAHNPSRTCDMTVGGIFLWADYFHYSAAVYHNTLFILGVTEDNTSLPAFSVPIGELPLADSVNILRQYCTGHSIPLNFSAVPENMVDPLLQLGATQATELTDWADYLYDAQALATFAGKKLMKKRNHVNRFMADHPDAVFSPLTTSSIPQILDFYERQELPQGKSETAWFDRRETIEMLHHLPLFGFSGGVLTIPDRGVVAFTLGEVIDDTLYVHIEKMDHSITGSGETICRNFASHMLQQHPQLRYINREDASGDEGLRRAKLAYNPLALLPKFNLLF